MKVIQQKPVRRSFRRLAKFALLLLTIMAINIGVMLFSYYRYGTYNYIRSGMGIMNVLVTNSNYVQIQYNPLSYVVNKDGMEEFLAHMQEKGYVQLTQNNGTEYFFQKGDELYAVNIEEGMLVTRVRFEKNPIAE